MSNHIDLIMLYQEADRVSLDEFPDGEPQTRGDKYVCDAGTSTADLNQADDGSLLDQGTQTPLPEMPFALRCVDTSDIAPMSDIVCLSS